MANVQRNIAVIGAGVMGLCAAHVLSRAGHQVALYEKRPLPARNASFLAGGMLAPYSEIEHMPPVWVQAGLAGIMAWYDILGPHARFAEFAQRGSLLIAHDEDRYMLDRFKTHLPESETCQPVGEDDIARLEPQIAERFSSGIFLDEEAHLHPQKTMTALLDATDFTFYQTEADPRYLADDYEFVIDCRGDGALQDDRALRGVKGELAIVRNEEFYIERPVRLMHPRYPLYLVPRRGNIFMIGATVIEAGEDEQVSVRSGLELLSALYSLHPSFGDAQLLDICAGIRPAYEDNLPHIKTRDNIISCNGLFRHGFLLAPVMAECVAYMIEGQSHKYTTLFTGEDHEDHHQRPGTKFQSAA